MIDIAHEPITKTYLAPPTSRSFCIPYICYILTVIIPATLLINLQYSWPEFTRVLLLPKLEYYGYEFTCLDTNGDVVYNSNIKGVTIGEDFQRSYGNFLSVSITPEGKGMGGLSSKRVDASRLRVGISGEIYQAALKSCSINIYIKAKLERKQTVESISLIPLNFYVSQPNEQLSQASVKGFLNVKMNSPVPQSSILALNQSSLFSAPPLDENALYDYSHLHRAYDSMFGKLSLSAIYNNILFFPTQDYQKLTHITSTSASATTNTFVFDAEFVVNREEYLMETNLIQKLRAFIPIFMFLSIGLWKCAVQPLVEWMFVNKVYGAKLVHYSKNSYEQIEGAKKAKKE